MLGRQALAFAGEELSAKDAALAVAHDTRQRAEDAFAAADTEVQRLTAVRDAADARMARPGPSRLSADSLMELAAPLVSLAKDLFELRMSRPEHWLTQADVLADEQVAFGISISKTLAALTGVSAIELAQGADAGHAQAKAERDAQPSLRKGRSVNDTTMIPPSLPGSPRQRRSRALPPWRCRKRTRSAAGIPSTGTRRGRKGGHAGDATG